MRKQLLIHKRILIRMSAFFSAHFEGKETVAQYIQNTERANLHSRILYQARLSFRTEEEIKTTSVQHH